MKRLYFTIKSLCLGGLLLSAQSNMVFYNQGAINSSGGGNTQTSLYINGHMKVSSGTSETSAIRIEDSRIKITGNLYNDVTRGTSGGTAFVTPTAGKEGVIEFCGTSAQQITTSGTSNTTIPSKQANFVNFPNVDINNNAHVTIDARLAAKTQNIELTKGWLIVDSKLAEPLIDGGVEVNGNQESILAHLLVDGSINYNKASWAGKAPHERGFIQVNLTVPNEGAQAAKSIVGFGIPFKKMYNDYFMFNTLLVPQAGYTNGDGFLAGGVLIDPKTEMTAGKGYVLGVDLRGSSDPAEYGALPGYIGVVDFSQRSTGNYRFNRHNFSTYAPDNQLFGSAPANLSGAAYQNEELNTENITITLQPGYNYLSNPYTCPLNIDKLLDENGAQSTWGIVSDKLAAMPQMRNQVWILNTDSKAEPTDMGVRSKYTYNYQIAQKTGGTYIDPDNIPGMTAIAPLQMFLIRSYSTASTITIPKSERVMGTTRFLRNTSPNEKRRDDFIIEFRNTTTNTSDRASIVLRTQEELNTNISYSNVERLESASNESENGTRSATAIRGNYPQTLASQIYTKDVSGKPLTVQFLPTENTENITLWHIPPSQAQPLNILGLRLETKDKIGSIWLEDSKYNTQIEIVPDMIYETWSEPTDLHDRFSIRFLAEATGLDEIQTVESTVYAYAEAGSIHVKGFVEGDFGSLAGLYDANGRRLSQKTVDNNEMILINGISPGVYIVKLNGKRSQNIKLIVKQ